MSQEVKEFIKNSGVEIRPSTTPSFPPRFERNIVSGPIYNEFPKPDEPPQLTNEMKGYFASMRDEVHVSKLNLGMYNATVNKTFGKADRVDLKKILMKTPIGKTSIGEGLYVDTQDIVGYYGQFKTGFSHTKEYGPKGNINLPFFSVQFKLKVSTDNDSGGSTVNVFKNGKLRFSGGFVGTNISNQAELIRNFIINTYTDRQDFLYNPFEYNNLSGTFMINGIFKNFVQIGRNHRQLGISYISYEPELTPFMYLTYNEHKYILNKSGNVQISGSKNPKEMANAYNNGSELMELLYEKGYIELTGEFPKKAIKTTMVPKIRGKSTAKPKPRGKAKTTRVFMIGSRKCGSLKKPELVDIAKKMGVVDISKKDSKIDICKKIEKMSNKKNVTFKNTEKNRNVALRNTGSSFKINKSRCVNYSKTELVRLAKILNIPIDPKDTKITICSKIEKIRNELAKPKPKPQTKPKPKTPNSNNNNNNFAANLERAMINEEKKRKRGLNDNTIRRDLKKLYGDKWIKRYNPSLNRDVKNVKNELNNISKVNKKGYPFKKDIDAVKKRMVAQWKMERRRELEKKYLMNTVNVTGVNYALRANYKKAAANYIMNQKTAPSKKKMDDYRKYWLKFRANMNVNNARKKWNTVAKAARGRTTFPAGTRVEKV